MKHESFVEYVLKFYGPGGLYPETLPGVSKAEILKAVADLALTGHSFAEGDTFDREAVRDHILRVVTRAHRAKDARKV